MKGKVVFDGKPVGGGEILFSDDAGVQLAAGDLNIDGEFTVPHAPAGPVRVVVRTESVKNMIDPRTAAALNKKGAAIALPDPKVKGNKYVAIPTKYHDRETTDLKYDLKPDTTHELTIELKK